MTEAKIYISEDLFPQLSFEMRRSLQSCSTVATIGPGINLRTFLFCLFAPRKRRGNEQEQEEIEITFVGRVE